MGPIVKVCCVLLLLKSDFGFNIDAARSTALPEILRNCYRRNISDSLSETPLNVQVFVELIRKLEFDIGNAINIRILTTSLLHTIRLDGVQRSSGTETEFTLPYRASGKQFHKFKLIADYFTFGDGLSFPIDAINQHDLCLLHFITSNTLDIWQRGDEKTTCVVKSMSKRDVVNLNSLQISRCPIEKGVIKTRWGTISPSHIIGGVASSFQESNVKFQRLIEDFGEETNITNIFDTKTTGQALNNVLVSTIVGDLAEVVLHQAFQTPVFDEPGRWNESTYPRAYYINDVTLDMTSAELLGGIDGLLIANKVKEWTAILDRTRFSQIIDMYYSERGVGYDRKYRACERRSKLSSLFEQNDFVSQTSSTAKLLQEISENDRYIDEEGIDQYAEKAVKYYRSAADAISSHYDACEQGGDNITNLEIIAILDGTWQRSEAMGIISYLSEVTDISYYGSKLGVINGENGNWMADISGNVIQIFGNLSNATSWPVRLQLGISLHTVISHFQNKTTPDCNSSKLRPMGHVVLVLANTALITDVDARNADLSIQSLKQSHPHVKIIYVASEFNAAHYEDFATNNYGNDLVIKTTSDIANFIDRISEKLSNMPANILNVYCNTSVVQLEDYVTPGVDTLYEIHPSYTQRINIVVKFKGNDYGDLEICAYNTNITQNRICKAVTVNDEVTFNVKDHCTTGSNCGVQFSISTNTSKYKCSEPDCRYPDQVRLDITTSWTTRSTSSYVTPNLILLITVFVRYVNF